MQPLRKIKSIGRKCFEDNYWPCVLSLLFMKIALFIIYSGFVSGVVVEQVFQSLTTGYGLNLETTIDFGLALLGAVAVFAAEGLLRIGVCRLFLLNATERRDKITIWAPFTFCAKNFARKFGGVLWRLLCLSLWGLFIVPGSLFCIVSEELGVYSFRLLGISLSFLGSVFLFIKIMSYSMTPYILAEFPEVRAQDALKLSVRIMSGYEGRYFLFCLSFIGWTVLSVLTGGLLQVFYAGPYFESSRACFYREVRDAALDDGVISVLQLVGAEEL